MIKISNIKAPLDYNEEWLHEHISAKLKIKRDAVKEVTLLKKSVDARNKNDIFFVLTVSVLLTDESKIKKLPKNCEFFAVKDKPIFGYAKLENRPVVVGFGPAGMFAALYLAKCGAKPIVIERGLDIDTRLKKIAEFQKNRCLDTECNVQFGEGGAGTFSDGKLNTGVNDPLIRTVLEEFVKHGAPPEILYEAKPHIGTDKLTETVKNIRKEIISLGGEVIFGARLTKINDENGKISSVEYEKDGQTEILKTDKVILAIGHSARDTFKLLHDSHFSLENKNFSVGVRIEHLQSDLNKSMYGEKFCNSPFLPPADYKIACHMPSGRGIYSFCMCPGGSVIASSSEKNTVVTNGMSRFDRDDINCNSALLVSVTPSDIAGSDVLAGMEFQKNIEKAAFIAAGGNYNAPVELVGDFLDFKTSESFGKIKPTYLPGTSFVLPDEYLPGFVCDGLRYAIVEFSKKISCFSDADAILTGPETRSSSPVRILRDNTLQSVDIKGLYPCGEGAGYAGGIMTAAIDGIKCAMGVCGM